LVHFGGCCCWRSWRYIFCGECCWLLLLLERTLAFWKYLLCKSRGSPNANPISLLFFQLFTDIYSLGLESSNMWVDGWSSVFIFISDLPPLLIECVWTLCDLPHECGWMNVRMFVLKLLLIDSQ
jgi:hypothetical protein